MFSFVRLLSFSLENKSSTKQSTSQTTSLAHSSSLNIPLLDYIIFQTYIYKTFNFSLFPASLCTNLVFIYAYDAYSCNKHRRAFILYLYQGCITYLHPFKALGSKMDARIKLLTLRFTRLASGWRPIGACLGSGVDNKTRTDTSVTSNS